MLQIEDALNDFKRFHKNITADKKALASDKLKSKIAADVDELISELEKLKKTKAELQKLVSDASKIKERVKKYNDDQHSMMAEAKLLISSCGKVSTDTKTKDFAGIAKDADGLQAINDLEGL